VTSLQAVADAIAADKKPKTLVTAFSDDPGVANEQQWCDLSTTVSLSNFGGDNNVAGSAGGDAKILGKTVVLFKNANSGWSIYKVCTSVEAMTATETAMYDAWKPAVLGTSVGMPLGGCLSDCSSCTPAPATPAPATAAPTPPPTPTILNSMEQGAKFEHCIAIADWEGKTLADEIALQHRDANGCCPAGTVPGVKHKSSYVNAQVVCGFKADGTVAMSTSTSNGVTTCTYNQCYIWKQHLECDASGSMQRLNGCCAAPADCTSNNCGFKTGCKNYAYSQGNMMANDEAKYCATYNTNYKMEYTSVRTDDQANDKLQIDKVYTYTACSGGSGGGSSNPGSGGGSSNPAPTPAPATPAPAESDTSGTGLTGPKVLILVFGFAATINYAITA